MANLPDPPARRYLTTPEAARYCGYKNPSGLRKAKKEGKLLPMGRRGGTGPYVYAISDLDRFLAGLLPEPVASSDNGQPESREDVQSPRELKAWETEAVPVPSSRKPRKRKGKLPSGLSEELKRRLDEYVHGPGK